LPVKQIIFALQYNFYFYDAFFFFDPSFLAALVVKIIYTSKGDIAQLVEHLLCKQGVRGSNPRISTI
jgi:hypothetical protein